MHDLRIIWIVTQPKLPDETLKQGGNSNHTLQKNRCFTAHTGFTAAGFTAVRKKKLGALCLFEE